MATKLTREEKREQERQARIGEKVAEFKQKVARERGKRVYSDEAAFRHDVPIDDINSNRFDGNCPTCGQGFNRSGAALYEMVREYRWKRGQLLKLLARVEDNIADARRRMALNERPTRSSNGILSSTPLELERTEQEVDTLRECIARTAWATGWYVPEIMPERENAKRERMLSLAVEQALPGHHVLCHACDAEYDDTSSSAPIICGACGEGNIELLRREGWTVYVNGDVLTQAKLYELTGYGDHRSSAPVDYKTEQSAWVAAAALVGERLD